MHLKLKFIKDKNGKNQVIMPATQWRAFEKDYIKTKNKIRIMAGIREAMKEVKEIQNGKKKGKLLSKLLSEL